MSIAVSLEDLARELAGRPFCYLLTVSDDSRPHAVAVQPVFAGDELTTGAGRRTLANAAARPAVSLVFPPAEPGGYSLIVDGTASSVDDAEQVRIAPTRAVLHRPAPDATSDSAGGTEAADGAVADRACASDCVELTT